MTSIELQNPLSSIVKKVPIVSDRNDGARETLQKLF